MGTRHGGRKYIYLRKGEALCCYWGSMLGEGTRGRRMGCGGVWWEVELAGCEAAHCVKTGVTARRSFFQLLVPLGGYWVEVRGRGQGGPGGVCFRASS